MRAAIDRARRVVYDPRPMRPIVTGLLLATGLALSACGGDDDSPREEKPEGAGEAILSRTEEENVSRAAKDIQAGCRAKKRGRADPGSPPVERFDDAINGLIELAKRKPEAEYQPENNSMSDVLRDTAAFLESEGCGDQKTLNQLREVAAGGPGGG
jgi:hypothetical protein